MPPDQNVNNNSQNFSPVKVGIDPVFKSSQNYRPPANPPATSATAFNVLTQQQYTPSQNSNPPPPVQPTENNNPKSVVRTYKADLESAIATNHVSSINIAIAENKKMHSQIQTVAEPAEETEPEPKYSKGKIIILISSVLIIIGLGSLLATIFLGNRGQGTISVQELPALITTEYKDELNVDTIAKNKLVGTLANRLNNVQIPVNTLYNTYLTTGSSTQRRLISSGEFIDLLGLKIPDIMKRTLRPEYMVGTFVFGKNLPFIIFKTTYFENTYSGMLSWEKDLEDDLQLLFRLGGVINKGGILDELNPTNVQKFEDLTVNNKDVRVLRNQNKEIILLYGIVNEETVIITVNDTAFKEIVTRLNKEKTLQR